MLFRHFVIAAGTLAAVWGPLQADRQIGTEAIAVASGTLESTKLKILLDLYFEDLQRESPELATYVGLTKKYNGYWSDQSQEALAQNRERLQKYLDVLHTLEFQLLSASDQLNYRLLEKELEEFLEWHKFQMYYMPIDQLSGTPLDVEMVIAMMPKETKQDYENILQRLAGIPLVFDQTIELLKTGLEKGTTPPQVILRGLPDSIAKMTPANLEDSLFFHPFTAFPDGIGSSEQEELLEQAKTVIKDKVYPAYQEFHRYLESTYIPGCRQTIGASDLPNGPAWYAFCIRKQTTTTLSPQEIHEIGLSEVKRIHQEMEKVVADSGFEGTVADYFHHLVTSPEFVYDDVESLLQGYKEITCYIDEQLSRIFGHFPKLPYEVVAMPSHSEAGQVAAYYMPGSLAMERPGRFYVNTYDLSSRFKWQMESLSLHEAVPGHHFQISIAQELELPEIRKNARYTAYIEGWGLYSESLGKELGLYQTSSSHFGRLIEEMWRAVRLVVDTGMHSMGWTREQAIAYFRSQTGMGEREATTEIDRYIAWPGQALAYKIGELAIQRWRKEAEETLGDAFDIRSFHDALLAQGALPLDICERQMRAWIAGQTIPELAVP